MNSESQIQAERLMSSTQENLEVRAMKIRLRHNKPKKVHTVEVFPEDYVCTKEDNAIIKSIKSTPLLKIIVSIDDAFIDRLHFDCLLKHDEFLNGDVINAYINCIKAEEHLQYRAGAKVFLENTYISSILKRDGMLSIDQIRYKDDTIKKRVDNYLDHDMVFIPINIKECHWYLAIVNAKKCEIQVLDSLGASMERHDLNNTIKGLQRQIDVASKNKKLNDHKWHDLQIETWPVKEQFIEAMQTDRISCGLFMLNYMEYWTGDLLTDVVTQTDMTNFRGKLAAILLDCELNTKKGCLDFEKNIEEVGNLSDVVMLDTITNEPPIRILPTTTTKNTNELLEEVCRYIMSINHPDTLEKVWVQSFEPYPISLSLKKIQDILNVDKSMDIDCFNMAVRMLACDELNLFCDIKFHYMDIKFCSMCQYGRDPRCRAKPNAQQLAKLLGRWPGMVYDADQCKLILLPFCSIGHFSLFAFDMDTRSVSILDPQPIPDWFKGNSEMYYVNKIHVLSNNLNLAMEIAFPEWNDDVFWWRRKLPVSIPKTKDRYITGFFIINYMRSWTGECLAATFSTEGHMLRKKFLAKLLNYNGNESTENILEVVRETLKHIRD